MNALILSYNALINYVSVTIAPIIIHLYMPIILFKLCPSPCSKQDDAKHPVTSQYTHLYKQVYRGKHNNYHFWTFGNRTFLSRLCFHYLKKQAYISLVLLSCNSLIAVLHCRIVLPIWPNLALYFFFQWGDCLRVEINSRAWWRMQ